MSAGHDDSGGPSWRLTLAALGVCYGDIGTSPLYALYESVHGHDLKVDPVNVLGVLSLIFWTLVVVVTVKYLVFVLRADNHGEGGILSLMSLARPPGPIQPWSRTWILVMLSLFGASLLYGDGVLTPAISVLSAVEGLKYAFPGATAIETLVVPLTIGILAILFSAQSRGTAKVGAIFGPVMILWFSTLALLGIGGIWHHPGVLVAVSPHFAVQFLFAGGWHAFLVLGSVFLAATGAESLYADMGHFGRKPIQRAWALVVLPCLLLNYFGQGALYLSGEEVHHPFFGLAPKVILVPVVLLATVAAVVASQALISGVFSLTRQAVQLGYAPRMAIEHTSADEIGQIYVKAVNWALFCAAVATVVGFGSSARLAAAYGIAVCTTMIITTCLAFVVSRKVWGWSVWLATAVWGLFLAVELSFWVANMTKFFIGGWFPILLGAGVFLLMTTWARGRVLLGKRIFEQSVTLDQFRTMLSLKPPVRVPGTAVFMTADGERVPLALRRNTEHNQVLHEKIVLTTVITESIPYVRDEQRLEVVELGEGFWRIRVRYGFMENPDIPAALARASTSGLMCEMATVTYFLGRETVLATEREGMALWRERLFSFMAGNAQSATAFFKIPPNRVIEIGAQIEI